MNGKIMCQLGPLSYRINEKQVVVLKGENLKYKGKGYSFIIRIDPPEDGKENPVTIAHLSCKFAISTQFEEDIKKICYEMWNRYLDSHPSIQFAMKRDVKIKVNKQKIEELKKLVMRFEAQLEAMKAILKEIEI